MTIIKRDGRIEEYNRDKMYKVISWATNNNEIYTDSIMKSVEEKITDGIKIVDLFDDIIRTVASKISVIYPFYDDIGRNLLLLKLYKENTKAKIVDNYRPLSFFLTKGVKHKVYDHSMVSLFSEEEINELSNYIDYRRDYLFSYKGLYMFNKKYCKKLSNSIRELPQISYMVASMSSFIRDYDNRIEKIKETYDLMSKHLITFGTPRLLNALKEKCQYASCVLNTADDDTRSLNETDSNLAIYGKHNGGLAYYAGYIRSLGSVISTSSGLSDGAVPHIKRVEQTISTFNQNGCLSINSYVLINRNQKTELIKITEVKVGDLILSYNVNTRELEYKEVEALHEFDIPYERQYELIFEDGTRLITSDHHPISYLNSNNNVEYKRTDEMKPGDISINYMNKHSILKEIKKPDEPHKFYDLTVKDNNNYFACLDTSDRTNLILVHNTRNGACVVTFPWWHQDVLDCIMLRDAGGTEDSRARKLVYSMTFNKILFERVDNNEMITLFDPKETPLLNKTYGKEFREAYLAYENDGSLRKTKIMARELIYKYLKVRKETGNLYAFFADNVNELNLTGKFVNASNLCCEVTVPSSPSEIVEEKTYKDLETGEIFIETKKKAGEIGICNLLSINAYEFSNLTEREKDKYIYNILVGADNILDYQFYPAKEGMISNRRNRPIGIGVSNYARYLASRKCKFTDDNSLVKTIELFDDIYYRVYKQSSLLADERGTFETYRQSKWFYKNNPNNTPLHMFLTMNDMWLKDSRTEKIMKSILPKWDKLKDKFIKHFGVRFSLHASVAPTACQDPANKIRKNNKSISLYDYMKQNGVNVEEIQNEGKPKWVEFDKPDTIDTRYGKKEVKRVWYNGKQPTRTITFEDGNSYTFTYNHPLLTKDGWKTVGELSENSSIINNDYSEQNGTKIVKIVDNKEEIDTWDIEVPEVHEFLLSNGCISHNTSGKVINATEGVEPIFKTFYMEEGTQVLPTIVPDFKNLSEYYQKCWDIPVSRIYELASVRQQFLDQAQSLNSYYPQDLDSAYQFYEDIKLAFSLGLKTLYYFKTPKANEEKICEACGS